MKTKNLSFRLCIYFLISETILSVFIILVGYYYVRDSVFESYRYRLQYDIQEVLGDVQNTMDESVRFTENMVMEYNQGRTPKNLRRYTEMAFKVQPNLFAFRVVTTDVNRPQKGSDFILYRSGNVLKSDTDKFCNKIAKTTDWSIKMLTYSKPEWSAPFYNKEFNIRVITYARPFDFENGGRLIHATIYCTVSLDRSLKNLPYERLIKSGFSILLNEQNLIVYHPDLAKTGKDISVLFNCFGGSQFDISQLLVDRTAGFQVIHPNCMKNKKTIAIYWPVKSSNWFIISIIPENLFMAELQRATLTLILITLLLASITAAVTIYFSIRLVSPLSVLADDSRKIAEEAGFESIRHLNDLEILSKSMGKMKVSLASYRKNSLQSSLDKEEMDKDLQLAKAIEMGMVPTKFPLFPERHDFDCYGKLIQAKIVGGDLFDIFLLDDNHLFISICDTLGKGIPAAMFSVMTRTYIRTIANPITRLGKMMELLNDGLCLGREADMFATVLLGKLNLTTGEFIYCNAGHPHPIILRNDDHQEILAQTHGIPVGVRVNMKYSESSTVFARGESLIIYTDGVTEEYDDEGDFFGTERLISGVRSFRELSTQNIVDKLFEQLEDFRGSEEVHDDTTLVALRYIGK